MTSYDKCNIIVFILLFLYNLSIISLKGGNMRKFIEKLIILILSSYVFLETDQNPIFFILISLIISIVLDILDSRFKLYIYMAFSILMILEAKFIFFLPLIVYNLYIDYKLIVLIPIGLLLIKGYFISAIISLISLYLSYNRYAYFLTIEKNKSIRDDLKEDTISLQAYNRQLLIEREKNIEIAILEERNRISRELHDSVGHLISSSIIQVEAMTFISKDRDILKALNELQDRLTSGMKDIRQTIHNIYRDSFDLKLQIENIISSFPNLSIDSRYKINSKLDYELKFDILSIIKESITNVNKHSNGSSITINLKEEAKFYSISIKDDGRITSPINKNGIGLVSMEEIASKYNGFMNIESGNGFIIHIVLMKGS